MSRQRRDLGGRPIAKNSISEMVKRDPGLRKKYEENQARYYQDQNALEGWARNGFGSGYEVED